MTQTVRTHDEKEVRELNSLLQCEITAVETYDVALKKVDDTHTAEATLLRAIAQDHGEAAEALRERIREIGGNVRSISGIRGLWERTVGSVASIFGEATALEALKEAEEHGIEEYEGALPALDPDCARLVSGVLLPASQRHVAVLDSLLERIEHR